MAALYHGVKRIAVGLLGLVLVACGSSSQSPDAGCTSDCTFSCTGASCDDGEPCNGIEMCSAVTDNGAAGQACSPGTAETDGTECGTDMVCRTAACVTASCGGGATPGTEECDDANQIT